MFLPHFSHLLDKNGFSIQLGEELVSPSGKVYQVIDDHNFGYAITRKGVVEKLFPEVAKEMVGQPLSKRWKEIEKNNSLQEL